MNYYDNIDPMWCPSPTSSFFGAAPPLADPRPDSPEIYAINHVYGHRFPENHDALDDNAIDMEYG
jgi:hypothetical protein